MRTQVVAAVVTALQFSALSLASAQNPSVLDKLSGTWNAEPLEIRLSSDFDVSVWGPNASSVRNVEMTIRPSGQGTIKVTRSVVDGRGKTKTASVSVEEATLLLRLPEVVDANRIEPIVDVQSPKRCYPDEPNDCTSSGPEGEAGATDLEHDRLIYISTCRTAGSFGETLIRRGPDEASDILSRRSSLTRGREPRMAGLTARSRPTPESNPAASGCRSPVPTKTERVSHCSVSRRLKLVVGSRPVKTTGHPQQPLRHRGRRGRMPRFWT